MPTRKSTVGGSEILMTGTVVGRHSDVIDIYPFEQSPDYCLRFVHTGTRDGPDNKTNINLIQPNLVQMDLFHKWSFPNALTVIRTIFGGDNSYLYGINYHMNFIGNIENYTFVFTYTIFSEPIQ